MTRDQIASIITTLGDIPAVLKDADPADKAEIYSQLGLRLPTSQDSASSAPRRTSTRLPIGFRRCPRGESHLTYMPVLTGELVFGDQGLSQGSFPGLSLMAQSAQAQPPGC